MRRLLEGLPTRLGVVGGAGRPRLPAEEDSPNGRLIALVEASRGGWGVNDAPDTFHKMRMRRTDSTNGVGIHHRGVVGMWKKDD